VARAPSALCYSSKGGRLWLRRAAAGHRRGRNPGLPEEEPVADSLAALDLAFAPLRSVVAAAGLVDRTGFDIADHGRTDWSFQALVLRCYTPHCSQCWWRIHMHCRHSFLASER